MTRVICTLPNASTLINGVAFTLDRNQMVSEDVSDEVAAQFDGIPGYKVVASPPADNQPPPPADTGAGTDDTGTGGGKSAKNKG